MSLFLGCYTKALSIKTAIKIIKEFHNKIIIGEIVGIYIDNQFIKDGRIDSIAMQYVGRLGYAEYTTIKSKFKMKIPNWKKFLKK